MNTDSTYANPTEPAVGRPRLVAVIDIGATSLRMQIAEINAHHQVRKIESFSQAVSIGKDSFAKGSIDSDTIEDCVLVLQTYRHKLNEYGISKSDQIRVIATSGVREAANRLAFVDRIFVATGFEIEPFEEAELHRVTYLGVLPFIQSQPDYFSGNALVIEVGGGSSEVLMLQKNDVAYSRTFRLGALRLRKSIDRFQASEEKSRSLMETQILQTIKELKSSTRDIVPDRLVTMGGDIRFAAKEINQRPVTDKIVELSVESLTKFTNQILGQSSDSLATRFHMSLPDAQTLGPALLTQLMFAREFNLTNVLVANVSLRDGLLQEMAEGKGWADSIQEQIVRSAVQAGRKFHFDEDHATHVSHLACSLFDQLSDVHELSGRYRKIVQIAALLHDIGFFINAKSRHKHSMYLILNSEFFGIGSQDLHLIALVARYHRRAKPQPTHEGYSRLDRRIRVAVAKLAAILRIAKALDVSLSQRIKSVKVDSVGTRMYLETSGVADISLEQIELSQASGLFKDIFGKNVTLINADDQV